MKSWLIAASILCLAACSSGGGTIPTNASTTILAPITALDADIRPYTPGVDEQPEIPKVGTLRQLTDYENREVVQAAVLLGDPNRIVFHHTDIRGVQNVIVGGNGEAVGMWSNTTMIGQGSITNMGVQPNFITNNGSMFFHTHQFVVNQCFEYGINYSYAAAYVFGYNWCTGGNTPQGFMVNGLVGPPGGTLNTWQANGHGYLLAWDSTMGIYKIALEEVQENNGWHLLGYNWTTQRYVDLMNGFGVTGTKGPCCGWDVFEEHGAPGSTCNYDSAFPKGQHLLYDEKKQVLVNGVWHFLDKVPIGGFTYGTQTDCADISGTTHSGYASPYYSGQYFPNPATSSFGAQHAGDWWMTQR
jgi:hypothetical protein